MNTEQKIDYLKEDPIIPGQEVALISFVEPKEKRLLKNRESFFATRFLKGFIEEYKRTLEYIIQNPNIEKTKENEENLDISYENIKNKYYNFQKFNLSELEKEFEEKENTDKVPVVTGFKVRGIYPNQLVTKTKAQELQQYEPAINVYCIPVGKWIPYCPLNEQEIESEYQTNELNELLKKKNDEHIKNELEYNQRKGELLKKAQKENEMKKLETINEEKKNVLVEEIIDEIEKEPIKTDTEKKITKKINKKVNNKRKVNKKK